MKKHTLALFIATAIASSSAIAAEPCRQTFTIKTAAYKPEKLSVVRLKGAEIQKTRASESDRRESDLLGRYVSTPPDAKIKIDTPASLEKRGSLWHVCSYSATLSTLAPKPTAYISTSLAPASCLSRAMEHLGNGYAKQDETFVSEGTANIIFLLKKNLAAISAPSEEEAKKALDHAFSRAKSGTLAEWTSIATTRNSQATEDALGSWFSQACPEEFARFQESFGLAR